MNEIEVIMSEEEFIEYYNYKNNIANIDKIVSLITNCKDMEKETVAGPLDPARGHCHFVDYSYKNKKNTLKLRIG